MTDDPLVLVEKSHICNNRQDLDVRGKMRKREGDLQLHFHLFSIFLHLRDLLSIFQR